MGAGIGDTAGRGAIERGGHMMTGVPTSLTAYFAAVPDPHGERTKQHRLLILTIALCAVICGTDDFVGQ